MRLGYSSNTSIARVARFGSAFRATVFAKITITTPIATATRGLNVIVGVVKSLFRGKFRYG